MLFVRRRLIFLVALDFQPDSGSSPLAGHRWHRLIELVRDPQLQT